MKQFKQFLCIFLVAVLSFGTLLASSRPEWSPPIQKYQAFTLTSVSIAPIHYVAPINIVATSSGLRMRTFSAPPLRFDAIPTRYIKTNFAPPPNLQRRQYSQSYKMKYIKTTAYNTVASHLHIYTVRWCYDKQ